MIWRADDPSAFKASVQFAVYRIQFRSPLQSVMLLKTENRMP
jgi:hypothetical protein